MRRCGAQALVTNACCPGNGQRSMDRPRGEIAGSRQRDKGAAEAAVGLRGGELFRAAMERFASPSSLAR